MQRHLDVMTVAEIKAQLPLYEEAVAKAIEEGLITSSTGSSKIGHAKTFVLWLDGESEPGIKAKGR